MSFYRRNLPHWQPAGAEYFITFRLAGSLPKNVVEELINDRNRLIQKAGERVQGSDSLPKGHDQSDQISILNNKIRRKISNKFEALLDKRDTGPIWLSKGRVAEIVEEAIHYRDQNEYDLYAYCIMSNHVHLVFRLLDANKSSVENSPLADYPLTAVMKNLKSYTAVHANKLLKRTGQFWHRESYDRVIRDNAELENTIAYTLNNPVKAGLIEKWEDWPHSYCKREFLPTF